MNRLIQVLLTVFVIMSNMPANAQDRVELESTTIIGNRELPKILYVVPWKLVDSAHIISHTMTRQMSEDIAPINRNSFNNLLKLHELRQGIGQ